MDNFMIAFVLLMLSVFASRLLSERAGKKLDQEKKAALVDLFSADRIWSYGILFGIVLLFFLSLKFGLVEAFWAYTAYIVLLLAYLLILSYRSYTKLKAHGFPAAYIQSFILASTLRFLGLLLFVTLLKS